VRFYIGMCLQMQCEPHAQLSCAQCEPSVLLVGDHNLQPHASSTKSSGAGSAPRTAMSQAGRGGLLLRARHLVLTQRRAHRSAPLLLDWAQMEAEEGAADRARELLNRAVKVRSKARSTHSSMRLPSAWHTSS